MNSLFKDIHAVSIAYHLKMCTFIHVHEPFDFLRFEMKDIANHIDLDQMLQTVKY